MNQVSLTFKECYEIFENQVFDGDPRVSKFCWLHFWDEEGNSRNHNCIACNLADQTSMIRDFLSSYEHIEEIEYGFLQYVLLLYLLDERLRFIYSAVFPGEDNKLKFKKENPIFDEIRVWANFFKHPKAFLFTHHPRYSEARTFRTTEDKTEFQVIMDFDFVKKYYHKSSKKDQLEELAGILANKRNIVVVIPNLVNFTNRVCESINSIIVTLTYSKEIIERLDSFSAISYYFDKEESD
ncbi:MAG: hypothetical protein KF870_07350 [Leadbetterella sp.]|nr:hypothetical protein [Leadbetterella sp.]